MNFEKIVDSSGLKMYRFIFDNYILIINLAGNNDLYWNCIITNRDEEKPSVIEIELNESFEEFNNIISQVINEYNDGLTCYSDDGMIENASVLIMKKVENYYTITFDRKENRSFAIRFSTNGSRNYEIVRLFMEMYKNLDKIQLNEEVRTRKK